MPAGVPNLLHDGVGQLLIHRVQSATDQLTRVTASHSYRVLASRMLAGALVARNPNVTRLAVLADACVTGKLFIDQLREAAKKVRVELVSIYRLDEGQALTVAFAAMRSVRAQVLDVIK